MKAEIPLFVVGASGLLSGELLRLVSEHPTLRLQAALSREAGRRLGELHPHLSGELAQSVTVATAEGADRMRAALDAGGPVAIVIGLPHGSAAQTWRELRASLGPAAERAYVVDLSADYRLRDSADYQRWYGSEHADTEELENFVYGLPELARSKIEGARRVASPGCFATALQLACLPAASAALLEPERPWVLHAITGSSGSGNAPRANTHHPHRNANLYAYALEGHRHEAELAQALRPLDLAPPIHFLPHSGPFVRGIHLSAALPLVGSTSGEQAREVYRTAYAERPFVEVLTEGVPDLRRVVGSNRCALGVSVKDGMLCVLACLDNVIKGGAGQALQCLNLMLDLPEEAGLPRAGLGVL